MMIKRTKEVAMSWNYRVVKHDCEEGYYEIMEVYYDEKGKINGYANTGCPYGENLQGVKKCMDLMYEALSKPVLKLKDIK